MTRAFRQPSALNTEWSDTNVLANAHDLIEIFLTFPERPRNNILDARCLPARKSSLMSAFGLAIVTEPRGEEVRDALS
ncbi:hypothetical protein [Shinella sp.]|uniref:hypothetical protein n=1 Tax=Shinella sp. TaxID=1870904 RepID=UPI003F70F0EF